MKLYIIRHGQTDWNVEGKIQGRQDIPLNAAGRSQAEMLAKGMEKRPVTAIYSSPQIRAMETAETLARAQGVTVIPVPELAEIGYGDWEGRTASDILAASGHGGASGRGDAEPGGCQVQKSMGADKGGDERGHGCGGPRGNAGPFYCPSPGRTAGRGGNPGGKCQHHHHRI